MPGDDRLTRVFRILWTHVLVTCVQNILVHERSTRCDLSEKADFDWLTNLHPLSLLYEDLSRVLASIAPVQTGHPVLLGMISFLERLQGGHEVMSTSNTVRDHSLCDTRRDGTLDDGSDRVHGSYHLGLVLRGHVEPDLLEQIFRRAESSDHKNVLKQLVSMN